MTTTPTSGEASNCPSGRFTPRSAGWPATARSPAARPSRAKDRIARRYSITDAGRAEVDAWLADPVEPEPHLQTILFAKVTLALMLGKPAAAYLDRQRAAHIRRMQELTELRRNGALVDVLLADHALFHLEADLRWIDLTSARLTDLAAVVTPERAPEQ